MLLCFLLIHKFELLWKWDFNGILNIPTLCLLLRGFTINASKRTSKISDLCIVRNLHNQHHFFRKRLPFFPG